MKLDELRRQALSLPETTEEPHHDFGSFRVKGKIFVTVPPGDTHAHLFVPEPLREAALAMEPGFLEKLTWGQKVVGLRAILAKAKPEVMRHLVEQAWLAKAPKTVAKAWNAGRGSGG
jgi:hypothetical protein